MTEKTFAKDDIIYNDGDPAAECYVVQSGAVLISHETSSGATPTQRLEAGDVFGESALSGGSAVRKATATAAEDTQVLAITASEYQDFLSNAQPNIHALVRGLMRIPMRKLLTAAQKLPEAVKEEEGVSKIKISADGALKGSFDPMTSSFDRLPFKIGGYPEGGEYNTTDQNNLYIPCANPPLAISRQHCHIEIKDDGGLYVLDLGSRFNTTVNGFKVGRGRGQYRAPLQKGNNTIILGEENHDYKLIIECD